MKRRQNSNRPDRRSNKALRRKYERLALTRLIARLEAPDTELHDELKMLETYCEFKKHDISERRIGPTEGRSSGAGGSNASDRASRSRSHSGAHLSDAVTELYGIEISGAEPLDGEPDAAPSDKPGLAGTESTEPKSHVA